MAVHTIRPGDTLSALARKYNTSIDALAKANNLRDPNRIFAGQTLVVPDGFDGPRRPAAGNPSTSSDSFNGNGGRYTVRPGDTLSGIASRYGTSVGAIAQANGISNPNFIQVGQQLASGAAYEGRADLVNTQPGDGVRFKGRGPIQLSGRANYRAAGRALGIDLENNPTRAADPDVGFRTAAWYWNNRHLNSYADAGNFDAITYRVNGGYNGKASRDAYYARALQVLGG
ncbi:LysM peptidoglycan-binding domain-containing protein [Archangium lansingense]|uniref:LysM peptidoglycan-binding domain-containing protein n=1 Tax=Archangium lansingense TaxID=2995310 RepID=A0ABT4AJK3_9BACT|nr:LysM peptidoglycan-binding domain-containing protein [Archangium lansinium]MCY1081761.1 LysM peptidoglycan-binding domain-containing protein [Archangium lansinium]